MDPHVHLRDLDWSHKATAESETAAALAGGYWAVLDMPNTPPATISRARLAEKSARFAGSARCDFGLYLGAAQHGRARKDAAQHGDAQPGSERSGNQAEYTAAEASSVGLKVYCDPTTGDLLVADHADRVTHIQAWRAASRKPIAVHAEGASIADVLAVMRDVDAHVHFCHVSAADEIRHLRDAKRDGLRLSVGVTPHHLYLTDEDAARLGPYGLVRPPLRARADLEALWQGVADGTVDVIESDHAPHTRAEKESGAPPHGLPGLETTLPLMALAVHEGRITQQRLVELLATNAQRIFGLVAPDETYTLVELDSTYVIEERDLRCAVGWTPFAGLRVWGRVREVRIRGRTAFDGEEVRAAPGEGRDVAWS